MQTDDLNIDPVGLLPKVFACEATPEEIHAVEAWRSASESNRNEYDSFVRLWNITGSATSPGDIDLNAEWQKIESAMTPVPEKMIRLTVLLRIAASIVLITALAFLAWKLNTTHSVKAPMTQLSTVTLPDGSSVFIKAGSRITYSKGFGLVHRNLRLKGEAYFEISNDKVPFIIKAGEASVRVTGTKFNVRSFSDQVEIKVIVTEGEVRLYESSLPEKEVTLLGGETGTFYKSSGMLKKQATENLNDLAWKTGIMEFKNTPLHEVADILASTFHASLQVDPAIQNCVLTVRFENQDLDAVLTVLQSTLELTITKKYGKTYITGKGC
jgi:ferric-dicitrate binding protein FerR (iron transport regulator)